MTQTIAVLGTGLMGAPMAQTLARAGFKIFAYNRTPDKAQSIASADIRPTFSAAEAIEASSVVITMLTDASAVHAVFSDVPPDTLAHRTIIQTSTIAPEESQQLGNELADQGANYLESPVLGSTNEAQQGTLIVMVGSTGDQFVKHRRIFDVLGSKVVHTGAVGTAAALKLAMNQLIASLTTGFGLSLALARHYGVDVSRFMDVVHSSALYAPTYDKKLPRMLNSDYGNPNFPVKHLLKDVELISRAAKQGGLAANAVDGVADILRTTIDRGFGDGDYSALYAGIDPARNP